MYGNPNCSDDYQPGSVCDYPVNPNSFCSFSIYPGDESISVAQLHIYANRLSNGDSISIKGVYDSITSENDGASFAIRAAFPFSGKIVEPFLTISITSSSSSTMTFGYFIQQNPAPRFISQTKLEVASGLLAQFIQMNNASYGDFWTVGPSTNVVVSSGISYASSQYDLLNVWIWKNESSKLTLVGSAYSPGYSLEPIKGSIVLQYVLESTDIFDGTIILNDLSNYYSCQNFDLVMWSTSPTELEIQIHGNGGTYCYTILNSLSYPETTFLDFIELDNDAVSLEPRKGRTFQVAVIQLISGAPINDPAGSGTLLATYGPNSSFTFPQRLAGFATTLMVKTDSDSVSFFIKGPEDALVYPGQSGFLTTSGYPFQMERQAVAMTIFDTSEFLFTYTVINSLSPNAIITVTGSTGQSQLYMAYINSSFSFVDSYISLEINGGLGISGGVYITYSIEAVGDSTTTVTTTSTPILTTSTSQSTTAIPTTTGYPTTTHKSASFSSLCCFVLLMLRIE